MKTIIANNPAIDYFLAKFRVKNSRAYECNFCIETIAFFLAGEISKHLNTKDICVKTPLAESISPVISEEVILIPVLRAGVSMLSGFFHTLRQRLYGQIKMITQLPYWINISFLLICGETVIILDSMLATGRMLNLVSNSIASYYPKKILYASVLAIPHGVKRMSENIRVVFTAGFTDRLNSNLYVYLRVGDSGDRLYVF